MIKCLVRPVFLAMLIFGVTACVMIPVGGPHSGPHGSVGGGASAPHR